MQLIELLSVTDENINVFIKDSNNDVISFYDGKNSIDNILNNYCVIQQTIINNNLYVTIGKE